VVAAEPPDAWLPDITMRGAAADVLTPTGAVICMTATVDEAEQRMNTLSATDLYVLSPDGRLAGILPDYELLKWRMTGERRARIVAELMSPIGVSIQCATPLTEVALQMRNGCRRSIPVVSRGRLVGEVTRRNLLRHWKTLGRGEVADGANDVGDGDHGRSSARGSLRFLQAVRPGWTAAAATAADEPSAARIAIGVCATENPRGGLPGA
jgi:CBS domain-containing protein